MDYMAICVFYLGLNVVTTATTNSISQIHISYGTAKDSMKVMWSTKDNVTCRVLYRWTLDKVQMNQDGYTSQLLYKSWNAMKFIHMAELKELRYGQTYTYKVICDIDGNNEESDEFSFTTQPQEHDRAVKFIVYGDMGHNGGMKTIDKLNADVSLNHYDAIWHIGDIAYDLDGNGGAVGDNFLIDIQSLAARIPYMTSPGNHELRDELHHYRTRFSMPGSQWPMPLDRLWYSYDIGPVHFISFSSEVYFMQNENYVCQQFYWLVEDLTRANQNRDKQPWIVAMGHRPMYCSNKDVDDCTGRIFGYMVRNGLEDLFYAQGVDLVLQAHEHSYERLWPVYKKKVLAYDYHNPKAPVHIISGAAGSSEGADPMGYNDPWSAFTSSEGSMNSYGRLHVHNASHLYFEQIKVKDGHTLDSVWIVQFQHGPNVAGLNCSSENAHESCTCPPLIRYITLIIVASVVLLLVVTCGIVCCCVYRRRKKNNKPMPWCCKDICQRQRRFHSLLVNVEEENDDDTDILI